MDAVLVWVNPIQDGHDRKKLDDMLRKVSDAGIYVSAHPDVIQQMGTKQILVKTKEMAWGLKDTVEYDTFEQMQNTLPNRLGSGEIRVLKRNKGQSGSGVWLVRFGKLNENDPKNIYVNVRHAERGSVEHQILLNDFFDDLCSKHGCFDGSDDSKIIDQAYCPRLAEGMIRAYMVHDRV